MQNVITLTNGQNMTITGVEKMSGVTSTDIRCILSGKDILVSGEKLEVLSLDNENKILKINGEINSSKFVSPKIPFLKRIFK